MAAQARYIATVILATLTLLLVSLILFNREYVDTLEGSMTTDDGNYFLTIAREVSLRCDELGLNSYVDGVRTGWKEFIGMTTQ
jgi:hypothetical protein